MPPTPVQLYDTSRPYTRQGDFLPIFPRLCSSLSVLESSGFGASCSSASALIRAVLDTVQGGKYAYNSYAGRPDRLCASVLGWAAFIRATAFAAADEIRSTSRRALVFSLVIGMLTGGAMLVLHDLAAVRRGLPIGWIDLWLVPVGTVGALTGVAVRTWTQRWLHPDLMRLLGSISAAVVTALVGQSGWQVLGPIL